MRNLPREVEHFAPEGSTRHALVYSLPLVAAPVPTRDGKGRPTAEVVAQIVHSLLGDRVRVAVRAYDGSEAGCSDPRATLVLRSPTAIRRIISRPGELGFVRAFVTGDLDVEGDLYYVLELGFDQPYHHLDLASVGALVQSLGPEVLHRPPPPPPEEVKLRGALHSRRRDAAAVSHHYDVSNDFYRVVLGPSMTYSCAVFVDGNTTLEDAQRAKHDLICRKLALEPGMRLLDVGCGWGSMLLHAAAEYGIAGVGVTVSRQQANLAAKRVAEAGLADRIEIRLQDYREIDDGPFDAISSIGMFEHVGRSRMEAYFRTLHDQLRPGGRLLNHAIGRPGEPVPDSRRGQLRQTKLRVLTAVGSSRPSRIESHLMQRYIFPDGELHEVGSVISMMQDSGFEVRHLESLREHYAMTLRHWVDNLETGWDAAVALAGPARARLWRLYMSACALGFEHGSTQVHQVLAIRPDGSASGLPLRPSF
ncbi:MAG: class I SAM-dependent methyltransferase [Actinobacteria bacterium]|nr:class I SAM-dependent methyltransferase [Actinomycetota bacterium]